MLVCLASKGLGAIGLILGDLGFAMELEMAESSPLFCLFFFGLFGG